MSQAILEDGLPLGSSDALKGHKQKKSTEVKVNLEDILR
jgi:hypothetical protein